MGPHYLDRLFSPKAIAVFGASTRENAVGTRLFQNLLQAEFRGPVYPINPKYQELQGHRCYPDIGSINDHIDLAVITTPAATVPEIIHQCGEHGVRAAIVISAGFAEAGSHGKQLQKQLLEEASRYHIRIMGPNCLGLIHTRVHLNATFSKNMAQSGPLALVSQSGALCTAILDWAAPRNIGFSAVVSLGSASDIDFGDVLDYLAMDPATQSILLYIEGIRDARSFMSGLRAAARLKPVVVIKVGRHSEGSRAALSHTGSLVGADDVFDAALQRAGVVRATTIEQLFSAAHLLATHNRVKGNRLAIVTNGGGPGVMATDRAMDLGLSLASFEEKTIQTLNGVLPTHWSHSNPVDILGDATEQRYHTAVRACLEDNTVDGVLVMLTPQAMTNPLQAAEAVIEAGQKRNKPLLACWMGEQQVKSAWDLFTKHKVPVFPSPEASVEAFSYLANHHRNQQLLMQVPGPLAKRSAPDVEGAQLIIDGALSEHRTTLNLLESKAVLHAFGIPVTQSIEAHSASEALVAAESLGFPIAMKISADAISHKSDIGGVRLNINDAHGIRNNYQELMQSVHAQQPDASVRGVTVEKMYKNPNGRELIIGVIRDPVFGPVISFGTGGTAVEVFRDRAIAIPPLNSYIVRDLIRNTRVAKLLGKFRNLPPINMYDLEQVLLRVSEIVCELPQVAELDINPIMADEQGVIALDARLVVNHHTAQIKPYAHMAIHPYPSQLQTRYQLADGTDITLRPIRPEDAEIEHAFVRDLSSKAKYFRFMQSLRELTPEMLIRFTQIDYDREMAFIAVVDQQGKEVEIGVSRYATNPDGESCEFALVVDDEWQHKGIGTRLMKTLMKTARDRGFRTMEGEILADNHEMLKLMDILEFSKSASEEDPYIIKAIKEL
ncbi:MAG: bifunctional acetate--CoA ligase family protein/GNAT family N-acetyltransferase [Gammaproteobacteria bacterium]|jgi:acetyltransferase